MTRKNEWNGKTLKQITQESVIACVRHHKGNIARAAKALGITRMTLYSHLGTEEEREQLLARIRSETSPSPSEASKPRPEPSPNP